jgi:uncharacterized membrane protein
MAQANAISEPHDTPADVHWLLAKRYRIAAVLLLVIVALAPRLWKLAETDMWSDEILTELRATAPLDDALDSLYGAGNQVPFYFLMMRALPHDGQLQLRLPSVILGVAGILLFMWIVYELYASFPMAYVAGALAAVNPLHVMLSRAARPYPLLMVLALLMIWAFLRLLRGDRRPVMWGLFLVSSMLGYLTHYTLGALTAAQMVVLALDLRQHERRFLRNWVMVQAVAVIPLLLWFYEVSRHFKELGEGIAPHPGPLTMPITLWNMILGYDGVFSWWSAPGIVLGSIGLAAGIAYAVRRYREDRPSLYWLLVLALSIVPLFTFAVLVAPGYRDRYLLPIMPACIVLFLLGWQHMRGIRREWANAAVALVLLTSGYHLADQFAGGEYERSDWTGVGQVIAADYAAGDLLIFERWGPEALFETYFEGDPAILRDHAILLDDVEDTTPYEQAAARIWVIYRNPHEEFHRQVWRDDFDPFEPGLSPMSDWLIARRDRIIRQIDLHGVSIFLLDGGVD